MKGRIREDPKTGGDAKTGTYSDDLQTASSHRAKAPGTPGKPAAMYSTDDIERIRKDYDAKIAALENKIEKMEETVFPKTTEARIFRPPSLHSKIYELEKSTPGQLLKIFESSLKTKSRKPDYKVLSAAWGILFSSLYLSSMELREEIDKSEEFHPVLREAIKADCTRGGAFVVNVIKKGGDLDRSALVMVADLQDLAGVQHDGETAIHLLAKSCDRNVRPELIVKTGKILLAGAFDTNGIPVLFSILSLANLTIEDLDAIEKVFSKDDLRNVMAKNKMGRNAFEAFTEISTRMRDNLALKRKTFAKDIPESAGKKPAIPDPQENDEVSDGYPTLPVNAETDDLEETAYEGVPDPRQQQNSPIMDPDGTSNKNIKILLVDDSEIIRSLLLLRLKSLGYENYVIAKSGDEAVKIAWEERPDLVFMDINMPGERDGIDAAHEIRAMMDTRIIFLTGNCDAGILTRALETNPDGYLSKPFSETRLRVALQLLH